MAMTSLRHWTIRLNARRARLSPLAIALAVVGCAPPSGVKVSLIPSDQSLEERVVEKAEGWTGNRIAIIDIAGVLMNAEEFGFLSEGEHPVAFTREKLDAAAKDQRVKAIVLRINSPGGTVTASDILYDEIRRFKESTGKPVVAFFQDVAASGGYYLACASDEIIAQRTTVTGSIGVVMQMVNLTGTMGKIGITADSIVSGPYKDTGSPFREMRSEERELFQGLVDGFYEQFVAVVDEGRPKLTRDQVRKLADGRVYSAPQALEAGLVDRIGTLHDAIDAARQRAGIDDSQVVMYRRPNSWTPNMYAAVPENTPRTLNLFNIQMPSLWTRSPQFLYIWSVGG